MLLRALVSYAHVRESILAIIDGGAVQAGEAQGQPEDRHGQDGAYWYAAARFRTSTTTCHPDRVGDRP